VLGYGTAASPEALAGLRLLTGAGLAAVAVAVLVPDTRPDDPAPEPEGPAAGRRLIHRAGLLPGLVLLAGILGMAGFLTFVPLYALDLGLGGSRVVLLVFAVVVGGSAVSGPGSPTARPRPGDPDRPAHPRVHDPGRAGRGPQESGGR
jgi:hypothetical protein